MKRKGGRKEERKEGRKEGRNSTGDEDRSTERNIRERPAGALQRRQ